VTTVVREERKVLTALFADVVGSTALGERLDAEDVKLIVGEAVARIVGEVEALGGHVKDLAGDGVLAFFGAPTTREDDAERAVRAALRIVAEIDDYGREVLRGGASKASACASERRRARSSSVRSVQAGASSTQRSATRSISPPVSSRRRNRARCSSTTRRTALSSDCSRGTLRSSSK